MHQAAIKAGRRLFQVMVHEPETWIAGGRPVGPDQPSRYLVRLTFPQGMLTEQTRDLSSQRSRTRRPVADPASNKR